MIKREAVERERGIAMRHVRDHLDIRLDATEALQLALLKYVKALHEKVDAMREEIDRLGESVGCERLAEALKVIELDHAEAETK